MCNLSDIDLIIERVGNKRENLITILQEIEKKYNYLPESALLRISQKSKILPHEIASVATFFPNFRMKPAGEYFIQVCTGTACHVKGAIEIIDAFKKHLSIGDNEDTDSDSLFTVEEVACLGCCMLAPAVRIGDVVYGNVDKQNVSAILEDFLKEKVYKENIDHSKKIIDSVGEVRICLCSSCLASGAGEVHNALIDSIQEFSIPINIKKVACSGISFQTPLIELSTISGTKVRYALVTPSDIPFILRSHFSSSSLTGKIRSRLFDLLDRILISTNSEEVIRYPLGVLGSECDDYCKKQTRIVTEHAAKHSPFNIDEYISGGGFDGYEKVLSMSSEAVIDEIIASGLRGRGGGGFSVGKKWNSVYHAAGNEKVIICNGDEGDPGAFMDRMILESFPFRVIEGVLIAAYALRAKEIIFYIRTEYSMAIQKIKDAIKICEDRNYLSSCSSSLNGDVVTIRVVEGAGAFVCGEESAMIAALEGKRGTPSYRPPYPSEQGLYGLPTLINNVESFATIPWIFRFGSDAFKKIGTETSCGSKTFALAGKIKNGGLIEVPMGMTLNEIIFDIGGGIIDDKLPKAVLIGGPSGGCIPVDLFDTPVDYEALKRCGAMMGSGGLVVLDETDCIVDIVRYFLDFSQKESCGKCTFCRVGVKRLFEILDDLSNGKAKSGDIDLMFELATKIKEGSLCGLGKNAPNPLLTALKYFREEFEEHLDQKCRSLKCKSLLRYFITTDCIGCTICAQNCPVDAITSVPYEKHIIDIDSCVKCGACVANCPTGAAKVR